MDASGEVARKLEADQELGRITALESIDLEPGSSNFASSVNIARVDADQGLWIGSNSGIYMTKVHLPVGSGSPGTLETGKVLSSDQEEDAVLPVIDFAEGEDSNLFLTGPYGSAVISAISPPIVGSSAPSTIEVSVLPEMVAIEDEWAGKTNWLSSGAPTPLDGVQKIAATHGGDFVVLDSLGERIVSIASDRSTSVLYASPEDESPIRDIEFDELGNLYWTTQKGVHRMDRFGTVELLVPSVASSSGDDRASRYRISESAVLEIASNGDLLVGDQTELVVTAIKSVTNLESAATRRYNFRSWVGGTPVTLGVSSFCACQSAIAGDDRDFYKLKFSIDAGGVSEPVTLKAENYYLLGLIADAPTLEYELPRLPTEITAYEDEAWSGRQLIASELTDHTILEPMETVVINGMKYGLYPFPANPLDAVVVDEVKGGMSFASQLPPGEVPPGSRFYDERRGYGSLVFDVPGESVAGEPVRVLPLAFGYFDGTWRGLVEVTDWGSPNIPLNF
ncbi:hypothetical protein [Pengzhenrongella sicca]|uniref:Uncharacterized protein n=1 Tax=Pengzhenrongella sicca TaxID=2819238 RepID=A0A8A4ZAW1_9MICO|nr:hypothetical protein [Pengzhenrongella sicca]QTE28551.1 hypothetical protein J4E96_14420 [Pengzhenrongella sicca]